MKSLEKDILEIVSKMNIDYLPSRKDLKDNGFKALSYKIMKNGEFNYWREKLGLKQKVKNTVWTEEMIEMEILKISKNHFYGKYMPTSSQILKINGNSKLHNKISKTLGYRGWAEKLNLEIQKSETKLGEDYEDYAKTILENMGYDVKSMTTQYPFDLMVDNLVKIDVKSGCAYFNKNGTRMHTFGINKVDPNL